MSRHTFLALIIAFTVSSSAQQKQNVQWNDINEAIKVASEEGKLIIVDVYTDWCRWCKEMELNTYSDSSVMGYIAANYIPVRFNPEKEDQIVMGQKKIKSSKWLEKLKIDAYPATIFLRGDGRVIYKNIGYMVPKEMLLTLQYIATDAYKNKSEAEFFLSTVLQKKPLDLDFINTKCRKLVSQSKDKKVRETLINAIEIATSDLKTYDSLKVALLYINVAAADHHIKDYSSSIKYLTDAFRFITPANWKCAVYILRACDYALVMDNDNAINDMIDAVKLFREALGNFEDYPELKALTKNKLFTERLRALPNS